ncbi:MAG: hypothetical protein JXJ17_02530 [Anaerolineae bacterium]|nr:hypothetical protein [Anaerolineae bacterium]
MTTSELLKQTWRTIREKKSTFIMGFVMAATGGSFASLLIALIFNIHSISAFFNSSGDRAPIPGIPAVDLREPVTAELSALDSAQFNSLVTTGILTVIGLIVLLFIMLIPIAFANRIAAGALIDAVDPPGSEKPTPFREAFQTGWKRSWHMLVVLSIPLVPATLGVITAVVVLGLHLGLSGAAGDLDAIASTLQNSTVLLIILSIGVGVLILISLMLLIVQLFADRACTLENCRPVASFRRGWDILKSNAGQTAFLVMLQLILGLLINALLHLPGEFTTLACLLRPVGWLINGLLIAFFSVLWTLAWHAWAGQPAA